MRVITLNGITRSWLKQNKKPIHYYADILKFSSDCLRELLFDTLQITNTVRLPLNDFFEAEIPADCIDPFGKVGVQVGQYVRPLVRRSTINPLANFDTDDGSQILYPDEQTSDEVFSEIIWPGVDAGGFYGIGAGSEPDTYEIFEKRNVIQVNQKSGITKIVYQYLSDGSYSNAATAIPLYAQKTIEAYDSWQFREVSKSYGAMDAQRAKDYFDRQHEILRARKNNLTPELLERIINRHRKATLK